MGNRAQRVKEQVQKQGILEESTLIGFGEIEEKASVAKQGRFIKTVLNEVNRKAGPGACRNIMRPCGYQCISDNIIDTAKELYRKSDYNMDKFLGLMNECHIGGGKLHMHDGAVIGVYEACYCGLPKSVKDLPKEYCECSAGWFERLFSETFGRKVQVEVLTTILSGAEQCAFKIIY